MHRILAIDDDPNVRQMICRMLERNGYEVVTAANGADGVKEYRSNPPDAVVTDIIMPEQEGIETIRQLKSEFPDCRIIAISGGGRVGPQDYLNMAKLLGAAKTISKPFESAQLVSAIREVLDEENS